ncbi:hypothetical protein FHS18_004046 [Paenibacillus phyllosphaerae]|uniref:Thioredoxin n=1 Tax=Paenibacillus phyllosphaerae TaxID=274593 RepID=A0A7W5B051_9BACL|nr:hypothetical protein [Paenibacillus phyllosphaerae]MBB3111978.1 hypothetical protein [Paenibacillus phyllosphaerae]
MTTTVIVILTLIFSVFLYIQSLLSIRKGKDYSKRIYSTSMLKSEIEAGFEGFLITVMNVRYPTTEVDVARINNIIKKYNRKVIVFSGEDPSVETEQLINKLDIRYWPSMVYVREGRRVGGVFCIEHKNAKLEEPITEYIEKKLGLRVYG